MAIPQGRSLSLPLPALEDKLGLYGNKKDYRKLAKSESRFGIVPGGPNSSGDLQCPSEFGTSGFSAQA